MKILVPMAGLIDVAAERGRLQKQLDRATSDLEKISAKLGNESFVARAPAAVVEKERARQAELLQEINQLDEQIAKLAALA
jgi:valyl-tRNA synthetase